MKITKVFHQTVSVLFALILVLPVASYGQEGSGQAPSSLFSKEQLAQMLAPIALYPDALLSQIFMASTYPLEIVEAERWAKKNGNLKGDALDEALKEKEWDPSVKSLCYFPSILGAMSEKIAQTTRLGDAFLAQQNDVMDMVQELRAKAQAEGNLKPSKEQKVVVEKETIVIESANPEVVYVPSYNPSYVYGTWWYPAYPPYYWWPWPGIYGGGISFWPGIYVGFSIGSWSYFDWHYHYIHVDWHKTHKFHHHRGNRDGRDRWHHDSDHRRGVAYRDRSTAQRFGQAPERSRESRRELRGFPERRSMDRQTRETSQRELERSPLRSNDTDRQARGGARERIDRRERPAAQPRENVFDGTGNLQQERRELERGRSSRENISRGSREGSRQSRSISRAQDSGRSQGSRGQSSGRSGSGTDGRRGK